MAAVFSGEPRSVWKSESGPDRRMQLIEDFWFEDRAGKRWDAPDKTFVDGASIPRPLWTLVGSPYTGDYRRASIVHDVACVAAGNDRSARKKADKMFFEACRAGGCSRWEATVLYIGVRIGAWYGQALADGDTRPKLRRTSVDRQVEADFQEISELVLSQGEPVDADLVEARTDAAAAEVATRRLAAGLSAGLMAA